MFTFFYIDMAIHTRGLAPQTSCGGIKPIEVRTLNTVIKESALVAAAIAIFWLFSRHIKPC